MDCFAAEKRSVNDGGRGPGWDARAIHEIAKAHYDGLAGLFEVHQWPERGDGMLPAVQRHVVNVYGTVAAFERWHTDPWMSPLNAIQRNPPNVWLTSYYSFEKRNWGFFGFTREVWRSRFLEQSVPGALVVVYGTKQKARNRKERGKVLGVLEMTHTTGCARRFMSACEREKKVCDQERSGRWEFAVGASRAWRVATQSRLGVDDFAPITYTRDRAQAIGAQGMRLARCEARKILGLGLDKVEMPVPG